MLINFNLTHFNLRINQQKHLNLIGDFLVEYYFLIIVNCSIIFPSMSDNDIKYVADGSIDKLSELFTFCFSTSLPLKS